MKKFKAAFFDMDGVLVDSMDYHCKTWIEAFKSQGIAFDPKMAYRNEGRTGASTINIAFNAAKGRNATEEEVNEIYNFKTRLFRQLPPAGPIKDMFKFVERLKSEGVDLWVVTGSAQNSLLNRIEGHYPNCFNDKKMVTGKDVVHGKPNPEPYLMALQKSGYAADEVFVVENAPLGVQSAVGAKIRTIAINTGILDDKELYDEKAEAVYNKPEALISWWKSL